MEVLLIYLWLKLDTVVSLFGFVTMVGFVGFVGIALFCAMICSAENGHLYVDDKRHPNLAYALWKAKPYSEQRLEPQPDQYPSIFYLRIIPTWIYVTYIAVAIMGILIPTSKETAYMVGAHYAVMASESPEAAKIVTVLRKKANEFLDDQLKEKK